MNVLCALKLSELWNTSLLFDLNYKYINGASLLALAKSIYYLVLWNCGPVRTMTKNRVKRLQKCFVFVTLLTAEIRNSFRIFEVW